MLILNAGIPRSGTILTNAIVRRILESHDQPYTAINLPHQKQAEYLSDLRNTGDASKNHILVHTHFWDRHSADHIKHMQSSTVILANQRDPRDVCVSVAKMLDQPIDYTIRVVRQRVEFFAAMLSDTGVSPFIYEDFMQDQAGFVCDIADRLSRPISPDTAQAIVQATSLERHKKVMEEVNQSTDAQALNFTRNQHRIMKEDKTTHITDRHIQSGKIGRWKTELSAQDQDLVDQHLTPIAKALGYTD